MKACAKDNIYVCVVCHMLLDSVLVLFSFPPTCAGGGTVEAMREIVEEVLLPTHTLTMSDEVGVEITRPVRSATLPTGCVRSKIMDGVLVPRTGYVPYNVNAWIGIVSKPYGTVRNRTTFVVVSA